MEEHELEKLGIFRIPTPIPFIQAGGPVNAYAIEEEGGLLLFDTGMAREESRAALAEGFARIGHRFQDINRIILSHGHIDHFGAAEWIREQSGRAIPAMIHSADADKVLESGPDWPTLLTRNRGYLLKLGVPPPALEDSIEILRKNTGMGRRLKEVEPLMPGTVFRCKHVKLEVLHMPGHTPGVCCLYDRDHRLLFSADHLLEHVSPNPLMELSEPESFKPLITYFESLDSVRTLPVDLVLPGHAAPFAQPFAVMDSLSGFYRKRQSRILAVLERGPLTVYEVMRELFPADSGFELVLMVSEALGNLELLEYRGEVEREIGGEFIRFRLRRRPG